MHKQTFSVVLDNVSSFSLINVGAANFHITRQSTRKLECNTTVVYQLFSYCRNDIFYRRFLCP